MITTFFFVVFIFACGLACGLELQATQRPKSRLAFYWQRVARVGSYASRELYR